jgi:hypothetical protein
MARSTFEGPVLSGDQRFSPYRNVGYARLQQDTYIDFANTGGNGTAGYPGASTQFVNGNTIPNLNASVYTAAGGATNPPVVVVPTADAATAIYRGVTFWVPTGCTIETITVDYILALTTVNSTYSSVAWLFSNGFVTSAPTYATVTLGTTTVGTAGRQTTTYSAANLTAMLATTSDINTGTSSPSNLSQIVGTLAIVGTGLSALSAGKFNVRIGYTQNDPNIGNTTTYPYGNFD